MQEKKIILNKAVTRKSAEKVHQVPWCSSNSNFTSNTNSNKLIISQTESKSKKLKELILRWKSTMKLKTMMKFRKKYMMRLTILTWTKFRMEQAYKDKKGVRIHFHLLIIWEECLEVLVQVEQMLLTTPLIHYSSNSMIMLKRLN